MRKLMLNPRNATARVQGRGGAAIAQPKKEIAQPTEGDSGDAAPSGNTEDPT